MTCDRYRSALLRAAGSNDELDAKLARHLEHCPACRMTLRSSRELFSRIDRTLRAQVNADPPAGFLTRLRLRVSQEETAQPGANHAWHAAGAALALVFIAVLYSLANRPQSSVQGILQTPAKAAPLTVKETRSARAMEPLAARPDHHAKRPSVESAAPRKPEILVPPDEQKAFAQFVACLARRDAMAQAVVTPAPNKTLKRNTELPQIPLADIADLQLSQAQPQPWINQAGSSE